MEILLDPRFKKLYFKNKLACADMQLIKYQNSFRIFIQMQIHYKMTIPSKFLKCPRMADFWTYHPQLLKDNRVQHKEKYNRSEMPDELRHYLNEVSISKDSDRLLFWKMYRGSVMADLAFGYLAILATSVPSERLF